MTINLITPEVRLNKGTPNYKENCKNMPESTIRDAVRKQNAKIRANMARVNATICNEFKTTREEQLAKANPKVKWAF